MKLIEILLEILGWLQITIGTALGFGLIAFLVYIKTGDDKGKLIVLIILIVGFILGAIWATRIWIKHGTIEWLSRIRRTS